MSSFSVAPNTWTGSKDCLTTFTQDLSSYDQELSLNFVSLVEEYWSNRLSVHSFLVQVSSLLKYRPALVRNLNSVIATDHRLDVVLDEQEVALIIIKTPSRGEIHPISAKAVAQDSEITDTETLRNVLFWGDLKLAVTKLQPFWARGVMELLQIEISRGCMDKIPIQPTYTKMCMRHLQSLSKRHNALPPSFLIHNVVKEGEYPVKCGGFADIWKGTFDKQKVCLKVLRFFLSAGDAERQGLLKKFNREALTWKRLNHPHVLPFMGVSAQLFHPTFCLISPWMQHGNIMEFLVINPDFDRWNALTEIVEAVKYLHEQDPPIVHADLKGANVLISDDHHCRLADFGLSFVTESQGLSSSSGTHGSLRWMAPELLIAETPSKRTGPGSNNSTARDIYALGCTVLEIFTGKPPFYYNKIDYLVITEVTSGRRPIRPQAIGESDTPFPEELWTITEVCWAQNPRDRPTARVILQMIKEHLLNTTLEDDLADEYKTSPSLLFQPIPEEDADINEPSPRSSMDMDDIIDLYTFDLPVGEAENLDGPGGRSPLARLPQTVANIISSEQSGSREQTSSSQPLQKTLPPDLHRLTTTSIPTRSVRNPAQSPQVVQTPDHTPLLSSPISPATSQSSPLTTKSGSPFDSPVLGTGNSSATVWSDYSNSKSDISLQHSLSPVISKKPSFPQLNGFFSPLVANQAGQPPSRELRFRSKSALPLQTNKLRPFHTRFRSLAGVAPSSSRTTDDNQPSVPGRTDLLLSSDLPHIKIIVARSFVPPKPAPTFFAAIKHGNGRTEWTIFKTYADLVHLDQSLRKILREEGKIQLVPLPKERLWNDNTPGRVDQRKLQLEHYLQSLIQLPISAFREIISFLTSNVTETTFPSLPPGYKEGYLTKRGRRFGGWKTRYFCLTGNVLKYLEWRGGSLIGSISLADTVIEPIDVSSPPPAGDEDEYYQHGFMICEGRGPAATRHILCAENDEERDSWVSTLLFARNTGSDI